MTEILRLVAQHWDDILVAVTLVMSLLVGLAHGLVWVAGILSRLASMTASKSDDAAAARFASWASRMSRGADWLATQHARLMPPRTPSIERVEHQDRHPEEP